MAGRVEGDPKGREREDWLTWCEREWWGEQGSSDHLKWQPLRAACCELLQPKVKWPEA